MPATNGLRPGILFDVDGTLVDTNYLHTLAWARAFAEHGQPQPMNAIHRLVGMGGDQLVAELLGHEVPELDEARARHYRPLLPEVRVFPGAQPLVRAVHASGLAVVLASSSPKDELGVIRELLDLEDVLTAVTQADDVERAKPAPDVIHAGLSAGSVDPRRALLVGDSVWDIRAARAAGIGCIGVETGGFSAHELREDGALHVYRDVEELFLQLDTSPIAHLLNDR